MLFYQFRYKIWLKKIQKQCSNTTRKVTIMVEDKLINKLKEI